MSTEYRGRVETPKVGTEQASLGDLLNAISSDITTLIRQEVQLAKAELRQEVKTAGMAAGMFGGAIFAGYMVALFLSFAAWWGLENVLDAGLSALVVAGIWAIAAGVLFGIGRGRARRVKTLPLTVGSARQIPDALRRHRGDGGQRTGGDGHRSRREESR